MLPDAEDGPAKTAQGAVHLPVAGPVGGDLAAPKLRVALGFDAVSRAVVLKHRGLALGLRVRQLSRGGDYYTSTGVIKGLVWGVDYRIQKC